MDIHKIVLPVRDNDYVWIGVKYASRELIEALINPGVFVAIKDCDNEQNTLIEIIASNVFQVVHENDMSEHPLGLGDFLPAPREKAGLSLGRKKHMGFKLSAKQDDVGELVKRFIKEGIWLHFYMICGSRIKCRILCDKSIVILRSEIVNSQVK